MDYLGDFGRCWRSNAFRSLGFLSSIRIESRMNALPGRLQQLVREATEQVQKAEALLQQREAILLECDGIMRQLARIEPPSPFSEARCARKSESPR